MAKISYSEKVSNFNSNTTPGVGYFHLSDGEEAIVRFCYSACQEMEAETTHSVQIGKAYRRISCLRSNGNEPLHLCPLCASSNESVSKVQTRFFAKLIQYSTDESGNLVIRPCIWDKPEVFRDELKEFMGEYGDLRKIVFKVKRTGKTLNDTRYSVIPANQMVYTEQAYPIDFSGFDNFDVYERHCLNKTASEMQVYLEKGNFPLSNNNSNNVAVDMNSVQPAVPVQQPVQTAYVPPVQPAYVPPVQPAYVAPPAGNVMPQQVEAPQVNVAQPAPGVAPRRYSYN